jgi:hypothetical protein
MKTTKFSITVCAIILSVGLLFAEKPTDKDKKTELAELIVEKLNNDVQLTDSQKVTIKEYTKNYISKMETSHLKSNEKERIESKKQTSEEYEIFLNNILSTTQKNQRNTNIQKRDNKKTTK